MPIGKLKTLALMITAAAALGLGPAAQAQDSGSAGTFADEVDEQQLEAFVVARAEVQEIQQDYTSRLQSAENDQNAAELQAEAQEKMVSAVEDAGLSVQEFNRIAEAAQNDPEVQEKIQELAE